MHMHVGGIYWSHDRKHHNGWKNDLSGISNVPKGHSTQLVNLEEKKKALVGTLIQILKFSILKHPKML